MDERILKRALTNYSDNIKIKKELEEKLETIETSLYGPSGKGIVKKPEGNPPDRSMVLTTKIMSADRIRAQIRHIDEEIEMVKSFLCKISEFKELIEDKYVNNLSNGEIVIKYSYSRAQTFRIIDRLIVTGAMLDSIDDLLK